MIRGGVTAAMAVFALLPAQVSAQPVQSYDIPEQDLPGALRSFAAASGREVIAPSALIASKRSRGARGELSAEQAIGQLLAGTGLEWEIVEGAFVVRTREPSPRDEAAIDGDIVVTGTRIRGAAPVGSNLITIDRQAIDRSGYATTQQLLSSLPQNFGGGANEGTVGFSVRNNTSTNYGFGSGVNLRGLGSTSTLVLIDGSRPALGGGSGTFVDLTLIPSSAIERVEILADGASALYGSDAVAGVVNVRLRSNFQGAETRARYGFADGLEEQQASQLFGLPWSSGRLTAGYEYYRRGRLAAEERAYATEDLRAFGGPDYRNQFSNPATIVAANGAVFGVPHGQNGTGLEASDLIPGVPNLADGRAGTDILPQLARHSAFTAFEQDLAPWLQLRLRGFFADRRSSVRYFPGNFGALAVTPANPFYVDPLGTRQPISVRYDFRPDLGPPILDAHVRNWAVTAALNAALGAWSATLDGTFGAQREEQRTLNVPNYFRLAVALADPNPSTAFNPLGDGSFTNPATIDRIRGSQHQAGRSRIASTSLKLEGPLFHLPSGDVRTAVGGEYRFERFSYRSTQDQFTPTAIDGGSAGFPLSRAILAGYAELLIPAVAPEQHTPLVNRLDLSVAARAEHYSDFGTTANPRLGITWRPEPSLTLRGTFGTSFRAPSFIDIRQGSGLSQIVPVPLADPASPTGFSRGVALFGNRPDIGPEKARTWTAGFDLTPRVLPGLTLSATYFDIAYKDRIANVGAEYSTFLAQRDRFRTLITDNPTAAAVAALYADPTFINPFGIPASAITVIIDGRNANLSRTTERGLDFDLGYGWGPEGRRFEIGANGTYIFALEERITGDAPSTDVISTIGRPVDLRLRARALASLGPVSFAAFANFVDGYVNNGVTPAERVRSWTSIDLQLGYEAQSVRGPLRGTRAALSITNLFDRAPPYVNNRTPFSASGFDPEHASPVGRLIAVQVTKSW